MDTYRKAKKLRGTRSKNNAQLMQLAHELGLKVSQNDEKLLKTTDQKQANSDECQDARDRLLIKLDSYQSSIRSKVSQTLSLVSVVLSIFAALVSIWANLRK